MKSKFGTTFSTIGEALISPEKTFHKDDYLKSSLFLLLLIIYVLTLASALINISVMNRPEMQEFQLELSVKQAEKRMIGASEADKEVMREQILKGMNSPAAKIIKYVSLFITSGFWLLVPLLFWGLQTIAARFFGGEEIPVTVEKKKGTVSRKHRRSLFFSLIAFIPIGFYSLFAALLLLLRNPDFMTNVLSMEDFMGKMDSNFSLFGLLVSAELPVFLDTALSTLTNPFYWWMFFIAWFGMKEEWRLKKSGTITVLVIWVILTGLWAQMSYSFAGMFTA